jgi:hypothetical protein
MNTNYLSAGIAVKRFPIVTFNLAVGESEYVRHYGTTVKLTRTGTGKYDFASEKIR